MYERAKVAAKKSKRKEFKTAQTQKNKFNNHSSPLDQILFLQRTIGNQAVESLFKSGIIQAKLKIGKPNDIYEQEADRVAEQIVSSYWSVVNNQVEEGEIQRQTEEEERKKEEEEEETLQLKKMQGNISEVTPDIESRIRTLRGSGRPLPKSIRAFFEPRFGYDFSYVRIHTDPEAAKLARALNAEAFTYGRDIYFGEGRYNLSTLTGKRLLAHELTHVVQQKKAAENLVQTYRLDAYPSAPSGELMGLAAYAERMEREGRALAFPITDLADLRTKMSEERQRRISAGISDNLVHELHLYGHGNPGEIQIGQSSYTASALTSSSLTFESLMQSGAIIYTESCLSAQGEQGWELFRQLGRVFLGDKRGWLQGNTTFMVTVAGPIEARPRLFRYPNDFGEDFRIRFAGQLEFMLAEEEFFRSIDIDDRLLPNALTRGQRYTVGALSGVANLSPSHYYFAKFGIIDTTSDQFIHASGSAPWPYGSTSGPSWTFSIGQDGRYILSLRIWTHRLEQQRHISDPARIPESDRLTLRIIRRPLNVGYPRI